MNMRTRGLYRFLLLAGILSGIGVVPVPCWAQTIQPPSAFDITVDGFFTDANEWSDVAPIEFVFSDGSAFTYTVVGPKRDSLYLMYDATNKTNDFIGTGAAGSVEFNVGVPPPTPGPCPPPAGGHHYVVSFFAAGIVVLQDGCFFDVTGIMEGARFFGTSPNSAIPHRMFELEVAFDCTDITLNCPPVPGVYSPAPSFWGATVSNTNEPSHCEQAQSPDCNAPPPVEVPCNTPGAFQVFGDPVSAACTEVMPGTGGVTRITKIHLPSETTMTSFCFPNASGIRSCPCGNQPVPNDGTRGCNNYGPNPPGGTGGAILTASGVATASTASTLVFHVTNMQTPATVVVLFAGSSMLSPGVASGAGVRCVATLQTPRPYKSIGGFNASSIDFPSANSIPNQDAWTRSNAPGASTTKHYYAAYRNPQAGGNAPCTPATAFNLTSAGSVTWHP